MIVFQRSAPCSVLGGVGMRGNGPRHGDSIYIVAEELSGKDVFAVYSCKGRLDPDVARFDPENWALDLLGVAKPEKRFERLSRKARPYRRYFGYAASSGGRAVEALKALGDAMHFNDFEDVESEIPAAYTYLGQFVFHDMSAMSQATPLAAPVNKRSSALDLDSVFEPPASHGTVALCPACTGPMPVGCTSTNEPLDLPRTATGEPVIGDSRNDANLPLAQVHMALLRFYNAVAKVAKDEAEARQLTKLHFQSVVLHDYLWRVIDRDVYNEVVENGRAIIEPPLKHSASRSDFLLPLEFAAACSRFGHSMIRNRYPWNTYHPLAKLHSFWENTFVSATNPQTRLSDNWPARWQRLLGIGMAPEDRPIMAAKIGTRLAFQLKSIPLEALPEDAESSGPASGNLAVRSLVRGHALQLNSGQEVVRQINAQLRSLVRPTFEVLSRDEVVSGESDDVKQIMTWSGLADVTPLWFYTLKEAAVRSQGLRLGPLGSRIVMETLHAAIEAASPSILQSHDSLSWRPDKRLHPAARDRYTFSDLIRFAGLL